LSPPRPQVRPLAESGGQRVGTWIPAYAGMTTRLAGTLRLAGGADIRHFAWRRRSGGRVHQDERQRLRGALDPFRRHQTTRQLTGLRRPTRAGFLIPSGDDPTKERRISSAGRAATPAHRPTLPSCLIWVIHYIFAEVCFGPGMGPVGGKPQPSL